MGRVRVHPLTCQGRIIVENDASPSSSTSPSSALEEYQAIISKCIQQSQVQDDDTDDKINKENAKLRKKYMKQSVAMASTYLTQTLGIDVSVIDVEIVLNIDSIHETDGCLASCFLDAGCSHVVIRVRGSDGSGDVVQKALEACDTTRLPKERLILHYKHGMSSMISSQMEEVTKRVGTISIQMDPLSSAITDWNIPVSKEYKCLVQVSCNDGLSNEDLISSVSSLSKVIGENKGSISLVDPTAKQLGLCYAACMKTDRPDGLYTTVVCTRSNEALGLVYSSKVSGSLPLSCLKLPYYCLYTTFSSQIFVMRHFNPKGIYNCRPRIRPGSVLLTFSCRSLA